RRGHADRNLRTERDPQPGSPDDVIGSLGRRVSRTRRFGQGIRALGPDRAGAVDRTPHAAGDARQRCAGGGALVCPVLPAQRTGFLERVLLEASRGSISASDTGPSAALLVLCAGPAGGIVPLDPAGGVVLSPENVC